MTVVLNGNPGGSTVTVRGPAPTDDLFTVAQSSRSRVVSSGSASEVTRQDRVEQDATGATVDHEADIDVSVSLAIVGGDPSVEAADPGIATYDAATGRVTRVADGTARFFVRHPRQTVRADVAVSRESGATVTTFLRYAAGSLGKHVADAIDVAIVGKTLATHGPLFSTRDDATPAYVWNAARWTAAWDLTCLSVWNTTGGEERAGTLVSPRHVLFARHYPPAVGATLRFVKLDGTVVTRTLSATQTVAYPDGVTSDTLVGRLDSDVPAGIGFARVLPAASNARLPSIVVPVGGTTLVTNDPTTDGVPCVRLNQIKRASVGNLYYRTNVERTVAGHGINAAFRRPGSDRDAMYEAVVDGDSGHPAFMPVNGVICIVTQWYAGGGGNGGDAGNMATEINAAMTTLGGGYQLTEVDVSGFTSY